MYDIVMMFSRFFFIALDRSLNAARDKNAKLNISDMLNNVVFVPTYSIKYIIDDEKLMASRQ